MTISNPELRKLLEDPKIIEFAKGLSEIPPGWYSNPELAWRVAGSDTKDRIRFYELVDALVETNKLRCISAWHDSRPLRIFNIEFDRFPMLFRSLGIE